MGSTPFVSDMVNLAEELRARVARTLRTWVCAGAPIPRVLVQRARPRWTSTCCPAGA